MSNEVNKYATAKDILSTYEDFDTPEPGSPVLCDKGIELSLEEKFFIDSMLHDAAIQAEGAIKGVQVRKTVGDKYNVWLMKDYETTPKAIGVMCDAIKERVNYGAPDRLGYVIVTPTQNGSAKFSKHLQYKKNFECVVEF